MYVYYLPITFSKWEQIDTYLFNYVSPERQEKITQFVFTEDKKLALYSGLIIRWALSNMIGISADELLFHSEPNQKPVLFPKSNIDFSISHTRNAILCCHSSNAFVGADIEKNITAPLEIMKYCFHPEEIEYVKNSSLNSANFRFYEIWTRKEAYTKAIGTGLSENLSSINTLNSYYTSNFHTWSEDDYICSIFSSQPFKHFSVTTLSESFISSFFFSNHISP